MPRKQTLSWETENSTFAKRLREIMDIRSIIQTKLARETGIQRQTISNYMTGQSVPDTNNLLKICKALNVSADYLIGVSDVMSLDPEMRSMCEYTKMDEPAVERLNYISGIKFPDSNFPIGWQYMRQLSDIILSKLFTDSMYSITAAAIAKAEIKGAVKLTDEDRKLVHDCDKKLNRIGYSAMSEKEASNLYRSRAVFSMNKIIEKTIDIEAERIIRGMDDQELKEGE